MSFETECFSMNSDISKRTSDFSLPNRKEASARATSVLPTPVGPRKRNDPAGLALDFRPARERRMAPLAERLIDGETLRLTSLGDDRFRLDSSQRDVKIEQDTFPNWIVTEESEEGTIARLSFDDYVWKDRPYAPNNLPIALAAITEVVESENSTDRVLHLDLSPGRLFPRLRPGAHYLLEQRFTDFHTERIALMSTA